MEPQSAQPIPGHKGGSARPPINLEEGQKHLSKEPLEAPTKKIITQPSWGERIGTGAKVIGLGLGATACGALTVALFPFSIFGGALYLYGVLKNPERTSNEARLSDSQLAIEKREFEQNKTTSEYFKLAGEIVAFPVSGLVLCIKEINSSLNKPDYPMYTEKARNAITDAGSEGSRFSLLQFTSVIVNNPDLNQRDLEQIRKNISKLDVIAISDEVLKTKREDSNVVISASALKEELLRIVDAEIEKKK